jgi:hypothetical protein
MKKSALIKSCFLSLVFLSTIAAAILRTQWINDGPIWNLHVSDIIISFLLILFGFTLIITSIVRPKNSQKDSSKVIHGKLIRHFCLGLAVMVLGCWLLGNSILRVLSNCTPFVDC